MKLLHSCLQRAQNTLIFSIKVFQCMFRDRITFLNCIDFRLRHIRLIPLILTSQESAVILPGFHHHGKISQLSRAVIDIPAIEDGTQVERAVSKAYGFAAEHHDLTVYGVCSNCMHSQTKA